MPAPPLPDMIEVLDRSPSFVATPGLRDHAHLWLAWGPHARARVAEEAAALARPSLRPTTLRAVGRTGVDLAKGVAPDCAMTPGGGCVRVPSSPARP